MHFSTTLLYALAIVHPSIAGYTLEDDYSAANFFGMFDFFTSADPTNGFVEYVDQTTASSSGLISSTDSSIYMGVDSTNVTPNGRPSVRLTSKKSYNSGLVILDLNHMPGGVCGTWPAFWMVGPDWPTSGEIDILEGVNEQSANAMTLHTGAGCSITNNGAFSGSIATDNCDINAEGQATNAGCSIQDPSSDSYGAGFNSNNGGVFATEWTSSAISVYFFSRDSIPSDITSGSPDPSTWGEPRAQFQGGCDISSTFKNQQIVFDTTFCGDWAGQVWSSGSCASKADTCNSFVENNPSAFADAHWSINSLQVFQDDGGAVQSSSAGIASSSIVPSIPVSSGFAHSSVYSIPAQTTLVTSAFPINSINSSMSFVMPSLSPVASSPVVSSPVVSPVVSSPVVSSPAPVTVYTTAPVLTTYVTSTATATTTEQALQMSFFPGYGHQGGIPTNWKRGPNDDVSEQVEERRGHAKHLLRHRRRLAGNPRIHGPHA